MNSSLTGPRSMAIVTGASRGLGRELAAQLLAAGCRVLTLQRHPDPSLDDGSGRLEQWACDLAEPARTAARLEQWLGQQTDPAGGEILLVNNAAVLSRMASLGEIEADDLARALRVGLEAPLLLSAAFLRATAHWPVPRRLLHISSGLGRSAMAGSGVYCASKAGLDHLSRCIALEEAKRPQGARSVSLAPGIIDTDMQLQLRSADPAVFANQPIFQNFKDAGLLDSPAACAAKILAFVRRPDFGDQPVADIRNA